ncbi:Acyl-CoA thioesterase 2 [Thalassovita gelatinovora]|uniref:Acyl-CoA thioesterase 2 n=1 Tax=Thalassovita gelatinovora TaxID=53501 RepID=A0A0N7LUE0_THAGE|nr:acyl-CoA thioesterase II [Thalassovita gelatinovora]CUH63234.1 Acyl-CoA thioesterase 2 [Thalassovita gelatinovora]SEQ63856.1 acyl-CoA thioesterase-2 [Thalassovita gelatinovora]
MADQPKINMAKWLHDVLEVETVEENFFRGIATPQGRGRSFGGQVIGQALMAAIRTVGADRPVHSLHAYFMRPGDATKPVLYQVDRDRDGRSFATRRVVAVQSGKPILNLAASFHVVEPGLSHQVQMPDVPMPEDLESDEQIGERMKDQLPEAFLNWLRVPRPIEMRPVGLRAPFTRDPQEPVQNMWFKVRGPFGDDPNLHRAALAYTSDYGLLGTSVLPFAKAFVDPDMQFASLDHAVWFHDDFRMDEWLLYAMDSPWSGGARGFNRGQIFTRDGRLVASTAQEGLIRQMTPRG